MQNNHPNTIREALQRASSFLSAAGMSEHLFIAEYLIRSYLKWDRTRFVIELPSSIALEDWNGITSWLQRAVGGEPIQYIVGQQEFYGEVFQVAPGVLIPRPETELLIDHILQIGDQLWAQEHPVRLLDLGTGSGAIAITIAKQRPHWQITALDLSEQALMIAKSNAEHIDVHKQLSFIHGSMLSVRASLSGKFDIIVSNPPYIPTRDIATLKIEVKGHEPLMALDGGTDGLDFYRGIAKQLQELLLRPGVVAFEVGIGQAEAVDQLLRDAGARNTSVYPDFQSIDRVVIATF